MAAFAKVAELGSFTEAARHLAVSTSSVTKSVTRLETDLGIQLLHRTTRSVQLTEYGTAYLERCCRLLLELDDAEASLREAHQSPSGLVRLSLPPAFARRTLVPALGQFYGRYPHIKLEMNLKVQTANPIDGRYDLAVHSGRLNDSGLVTRLLVRGPQKTVASPAYLERYGTPSSPADLARHSCIIGGFGPVWHFGPSENAQGIRVAGPLSTDSGDVLHEAALAGIGISQATWWLFKDDIASGTLVPILTDYEIEADPISIVLPTTRRVPAKVRAVVDFLLELVRTRQVQQH
ncbi:MAG TPA: LysR substrate-binding domain-containing protein [Devosiaceae bacterium]|nr:LysR substrate-binding domain-containing protein [Devosiaceae bacterium]